MKGYPSYDDATELDEEDILSIAAIALCEISPDLWTNRDSPSTFEGVATLKGYLETYDDASIKVLTEEDESGLSTDERTIWVRLTNVPQKEFEDFKETYYLPTEQRLDKNQYGDWY